jgi:mono/diheme cytochrome c family protein
MNSSKAPHCLLLGVLVAVGIASAQTIVKQVPAKPTVSVSGKVLYHEYCAVCHGQDGKGAGPAASALTPAPTDLTMIARKNNGRFPDEKILAILTGEANVTAHGSKDMPMWGAIFNNMSSNPGMTQTRIHALLQFVEEMQAK